MWVRGLDYALQVPRRQGRKNRRRNSSALIFRHLFYFIYLIVLFNWYTQWRAKGWSNAWFYLPRNIYSHKVIAMELGALFLFNIISKCEKFQENRFTKIHLRSISKIIQCSHTFVRHCINLRLDKVVRLNYILRNEDKAFASLYVCAQANNDELKSN